MDWDRPNRSMRNDLNKKWMPPKTKFKCFISPSRVIHTIATFCKWTIIRFISVTVLIYMNFCQFFNYSRHAATILLQLFKHFIHGKTHHEAEKIFFSFLFKWDEQFLWTMTNSGVRSLTRFRKKIYFNLILIDRSACFFLTFFLTILMLLLWFYGYHT